MKEQKINTRLPCYDCGTARGEFMAFITLAAVGVSLIASAGFKSMQYAEEHQQIAQRLETPLRQAQVMVAESQPASAKTPILAKHTLPY